MELGLAGKVVLVTGGSGSIGAAMAEAFAAEGARVAVTFRHNAARAEELARTIGERGGQAMVVKYDLADPAAIRSAVEGVLAEWGRLDVLVLSASAQDGTRTTPVPFEEIPAEEWSPLLRADVEGSFHTVQAALPAMRRQGWGRIILISANIVTRGAVGDEAFVSSKMALHGLGRTLATELAPDGILVNVVAPGATVSRGFLRRFPEDKQARFAELDDVQIKRMLNQDRPVGKVSTPADVANTVLFLSSEANGNVSGQVIYVAGGH
ncbi:SDR family oxidoreductase [Nonomuraea sp. FMUSA5-5]|uniref:SDR family oxidoreductase n=1 Tax=Nonomuraea composti TaxID=2720023 RepID=A0ABX1BKK7_9ACTN|nr:SDR family oxidoreductase [Nonomuraea sp. FMUSA5-5]NJP95658.1 SDR family oxidoreductase [Nonomuraea sp. FMUSA5-5]